MPLFDDIAFILIFVDTILRRDSMSAAMPLGHSFGLFGKPALSDAVAAPLAQLPALGEARLHIFILLIAASLRTPSQASLGLMHFDSL